MSRGGGVLIAYANNLNVTKLDLTIINNTVPTIDIIGCKAQFTNSFLYIPPSTTILEFETLFELLENFVINNEHVFIVGDFNIPNFINMSINDKKISNITLLDSVISKISCEVFRDLNRLLKEDLYQPALRIELSVSENDYINFSNSDCTKTCNYKKADYVGLYNALIHVDWSFLSSYNDINLACTAFYEQITPLLDTYVPKFNNKKSKYSTWYIPTVIKEIKLKSYHFKKYKITKLNIHLENFRRMRTSVKLQVKAAYKNYINDIEQKLKRDPKHLWNYIQSKKGHTRIPGKLVNENLVFDTPQSIVDGFSDYFGSVYIQSAVCDITGVEVNNNPTINFSAFTESEVLEALGKLKNKMTSDHDQIPSFLIKDCQITLLSVNAGKHSPIPAADSDGLISHPRLQQKLGSGEGEEIHPVPKPFLQYDMFVAQLPSGHFE
ncbi:hypothetical protein NQ318_016969 [Aromia moschata]|uniref:Endonuclease/exonuclease/phosphatase domain-containing protein n=1 Tax=Aromia moschata TaxID=1265417 RepID=A0AAV8YF14_9CUCU|nr:hypothetical protein NQ318_016969 [Aromia moschata]